MLSLNQVDIIGCITYNVLTPLRYLRNVFPPDHTAPPLQLSGSIGMESTLPKSFMALAYNATASTIKALAD